jgi:hypothetical protein
LKGFKKIEEIEVGDLVWSYNEQTIQVELKKVVALSINESKEIIKINIGNTKIECTPEHPFYVNGKWINAKYLKVGDILFGKENKLFEITSLNKEVKKVKVYNFEVEDNHNYYVSDLGILVHNNCDFVKNLFANNINDIETFAVQLKRIGNSNQNLTKSPLSIPGIDNNYLPSMNKPELTSHLGELMDSGVMTKTQVQKTMKTFNKAFEPRSTGGNLGKKR